MVRCAYCGVCGLGGKPTYWRHQAAATQIDGAPLMMPLPPPFAAASAYAGARTTKKGRLSSGRVLPVQDAHRQHCYRRSSHIYFRPRPVDRNVLSHHATVRNAAYYVSFGTRHRKLIY
jgi:hypothetical protein